MSKKKAQITLLFAWLAAAIFIIVIAAILAPAGVLFSTEAFVAGQDILLMANSSIQNISDSAIKESILDSINSAEAATENNIEVTSGLFKYAWILILVLSLFIVFLVSRSLAETRNNRFV